MMRWLAGLLLALIAVPALAQEETPSRFEGAWKGTIGRYPVVACLLFDRTTSAGAYYYLSQLEPIALERSDDASRLAEGREEEGRAYWTELAIDGHRLTGIWWRQGRSLPIALEKQALPSEGEGSGPCTSEAYLGPRLVAGRIETTDQTLAGEPYRKLEYLPGDHFREDVWISTFELLPDQPGDGAINAALRDNLPSKGYLSDFADCMGFSNGRFGSDGWWGDTREPHLISRRWLSVEQHNTINCGGPHPDYLSDYLNFDRSTGEKVDLIDWLNDDAVDRETVEWSDEIQQRLSERMVEAVTANWPRYEDEAAHRAECLESAQSAFGWSIGLDREGLIFLPRFPYVAFACTEEVRMPWPELEPFLNDEGKAGLAALRADEKP